MLSYILGILKNIHNIVMLAEYFATINYKLKCKLELILSALFITENVSVGQTARYGLKL